MLHTAHAEETAALLDMPIAEACPIEEQEELYAIAYQCYETGNYALAASVFTKLVLCNPFAEKNWRGLASSQQMQKEYLAAIHAWACSALLEEKDPYPHFHAAECYFSLNDKEEALKALLCAEGLLGQADSALRNKIEILKQVHFDG